MIARVDTGNAAEMRGERLSGHALAPKKYNYCFTKVKDARGREIDGLWLRNGRYYYQISLPGKYCIRKALKDELGNPVATLTQALTAKDELRRQRRVGEFVAPKRAPLFSELVEQYVASLPGRKSVKSIQFERSALKGWVKFMGELRLTKITRKQIDDYVRARQHQRPPLSNRTINLDVLMLSNCLKFAKEKGYLQHKLPTEGWKRLYYRAPKRELVTKEQIDKLCATALEKRADGSPRFRNGELFVDYVRFMQYSGARKTSALATLWEDVSFERRQVHLRKTKYNKQDVVVDFNPELEALLKDMCARRLPDTGSMFPSPRNEGADGSMTTLQKTLEDVRQAAGLPNFTFHLLRHFFISWCVMSGVDVLTVARWVGHSDGGMLIGKVYGHLSAEHTQQAAKKVVFGSPSHNQDAVGNATSLDLTRISGADLVRLLQQIQAKNNGTPVTKTSA